MPYPFRSRLATLSLALSFAVVSAASAAQQQQSRLPDIGTAGTSVMSIDREVSIGEMYMRQLRASAPLVSDPVLNAYLHDVGTRLVRNADDVRFPFKFFWVNQSQINAFAFFGGHVGVNTGLLAETRTESELASVLAHEIAHVSQRHIVRNMEAMQRSSPLSMITLLGSLLLAMANPEAGMAAAQASMAGAQQRSINYTRLFEQEADRIGLTILSNSGFDPMGAPDFFGRLAEKYRYVSKPPEMLLTHPLSESRIADTRVRAEQLNRQRSVSHDESAFWLAKYRVLVRHLRSYNAEAVKRDLEHSDPAIANAARYGWAIAMLDSGDAETAEKVLAPLYQADPLNTFYLDVQTDILLKQKRYDEAMSMLERAYQRMPNEPTVTMNYANAALEAGNPARAVEVLRSYLINNKNSTVAYSLLIDAYRDQGNVSGMHEANAELMALYGQFERAIDHLHSAHSGSDSRLEQRRYQARIEQLMAQQVALENMR